MRRVVREGMAVLKLMRVGGVALINGAFETYALEEELDRLEKQREILRHRSRVTRRQIARLTDRAAQRSASRKLTALRRDEHAIKSRIARLESEIAASRAAFIAGIESVQSADVTADG